MDNIIEKISSYNIFNNLLPGILFVVFLKYLVGYDLIITEHEILSVFFYYFIGMIISRIGSLIIEPLLKYLKVTKFASYTAYLNATKNNPEIKIFSEINNTYRTVIAMTVLLLFVKLYDSMTDYLKLSNQTLSWLSIIGLLVLFLISYKKQTEYVVRNVEKYK